MPSVSFIRSRPFVFGLTTLAVVAAVSIGLFVWRPWSVAAASRVVATASEPPPRRPAESSPFLHVSTQQQDAITLRTVKVETSAVAETLRAPGRVAPDESQYAFITPRAAGVVRQVAAQIGQDLEAGDLLAIIDSPAVAQARLELISQAQALEISQAQAAWQEAIYKSSLELIEALKANETPDQLHARFESRPIGEVRERLVTAYANCRLAKVTFDRNKELLDKNAISLSQFQQAESEYETALAVYQGLMDRMGFEATLALTRARQARRQAETSVRVAIEQLRVLGIGHEDPEIHTIEGRLNKLENPPTTLGEAVQSDQAVAQVLNFGPLLSSEKPVSTYELRAPFDGTILDRGVVVPGVAVDTTHQLFTIANLSRVWIEASIHESDFPKLQGTRGGQMVIRSRAYEDRTFPGKVLYTGDLVDEKSRMVKLLAVAENADRLLKPGMFVEVEIRSDTGARAPQVPESALLRKGDESFVYVRKGPEDFERRRIEIGPREHDRVVVRGGLADGEEIVVEGAFKLESEAIRLNGS